ncbi:MAG: hypothetical protein QXF25_01205 [Candidatus Pacearchaeota archaeon]
MLKLILISFVLLTSIPVGLLIAWLTQEELNAGKKWFKIIGSAGILGIIISFVLRQYVLTLTFAYIAIVAGISFIKASQRFLM